MTHADVCIENGHNLELSESALALITDVDAKGYRVIAFALRNATDGIVLVDRGERCPFPNAPYVTWGWSGHGTGLHTGHYDMDIETALADFFSRVERGF